MLPQRRWRAAEGRSRRKAREGAGLLSPPKWRKRDWGTEKLQVKLRGAVPACKGAHDMSSTLAQHGACYTTLLLAAC